MKKLVIFFLLLASSLFSADQYGFPDPYPEIYTQIKPLPPFIKGWAFDYRYFEKVIKEKKVKTIIEVGVFLGNWCCHVAKNLPEGGRHFAVDHWMGCPVYEQGIWDKKENEFRQFLSNIIHSKLTDKVIPVRMPSLEAAKKFKALGIKADLIYIDAAHDYQSVIDDLNAWISVLAPGGTFSGDDWNWKTVRAAVTDFARSHNYKIRLRGTQWVIEIERK